MFVHKPPPFQTRTTHSYPLFPFRLLELTYLPRGLGPQLGLKCTATTADAQFTTRAKNERP